MNPKHQFRWPHAWTVGDMPHGCVSLSSRPNQVGGWFQAQAHLPKFLECGCAVCVFCGQLLMHDEQGKRSEDRLRLGWWTYKQDWLERYPV